MWLVRLCIVEGEYGAELRKLPESTSSQTSWQHGVFEEQGHIEILTGPGCCLKYLLGAGRGLCMHSCCLHIDGQEFYYPMFYSPHTAE